jgi:hypothetical protein
MKSDSKHTWLVLLEFLEWPISPPLFWAFKFWLLLTTVDADVRSKAVSDVSLIPESVMVEDIIDCGSTSTNKWSFRFVDFFFVNEPLPDDPEAMEESSLEGRVCLDTLGAGMSPVVADGFVTIDEMLLPRPGSSSSDGIGFFDEGLNYFKMRLILTFNWKWFDDTTYTLNKISPLSMCILIVTSNIELSWRWRVS